MTMPMKNPTKIRRVQEEVRRAVGKKSKVDEDDIHQMDYLKWVVQEALRLHPLAPFLVPRKLSDSSTLGGYNIPPKTRVFINVREIQSDLCGIGQKIECLKIDSLTT
ncbi:hypothetical protein Vadar_034392 [Vaccinium darrowii]|uniref:Uncharacterized protein n=1 Tax=Vaccinium darrowii TaxID=229202 RepID=A0ACB7ZPD6_9ERIC|nr:hypothetical protein Vadar_034392 [Vaccinium darrowii]